MASGWRLERRERSATTAEKKERGGGLKGFVDLVLIDPAGEERLLGRSPQWPGAGGHWLADFGFVPGGRYAWAVEGASYLGDRDYWLHLYPLEPPFESTQLILHDDHEPGDVRFAPDGSAVWCRRNGYGFGLQPDWIERTLLPGGERERVEEWPDGLVSDADCSNRRGSAPSRE